MTTLSPRRPDVGTGDGSRPGTRVSAGSVGRRRPLPSGRAVAGGFFVAAAATLVLTAWLGATRSHGQAWVVARHDLAAGTTLGPGDLTTESMVIPGGPTGDQAFHLPGSLEGHVLAAPLLRGALVQQGVLVAADRQPALRPVTIGVDTPDTMDLGVGTVVDVLVTDGSDPSSATTVVLRGARVLDVSTTGSSLIASSSGSEVTLGVGSLAQVEAVVHAAHTGVLSVVVGERSDGRGLGAGPSSPSPRKVGGG